jgi:hypothetical protein
MANEIPTGGTQSGGAPKGSDQNQAGGSSGTGGYGNAQNQQFHQGQEGQLGQTGYGSGAEPTLSRGERFDEEQGGGRGADSVTGETLSSDRREQDETTQADEFLEDQQAHQDRGQSVADQEA